MSKEAFHFYAAILSLSIIVGCSCGGSVPSQPVPPSSGAPFTLSSGGTSVPFTSSIGSGVIMIPAGTSVPTGDALSVSTSVSPFGSAGAIQALKRRPQSGGTDVPILYLGLGFSTATTVNGQPGFSFTLPSSVNIAAGNFYVAYFDPSVGAWAYQVLGPGAVSGRVVTFAGTTTPVTFTTGVTYFYAIYQLQGASTPSPSPTPTASPVPTATPTSVPLALTVAPGETDLIGTGASNGKTFVAHETAYSGTISLQSTSCAGLVTLSPSSGSGPSLAISAVGLAAGSCTATYQDTYGQTTTEIVTVTTAGIGLQ